MNRIEAQKLVESELARNQDPYNPTDYAVLEIETIEKEWGWVFFYQSKKYIETGELQSMFSKINIENTRKTLKDMGGERADFMLNK
jgi:TATA-box binding protein (TBP) (component of TFIID and TFIIIB)